MMTPDPRLFDAVTHYPERRAKIYGDELAARLQEIRNKAADLAAKDGAQPIPEEVVPALIERHERMTQAMWQAEGRCMSWFIVGPANFPTAQNEKRQRTRDRRAEEVSTHLAAALRRLERIAFPHGQGDMIRAADPEALDKLRAELSAAEQHQAHALKANSILRKHGAGARPQLEAAGLPEKMIASALVCDSSGRPFGFFTSNSAAKIRRIKDRISALEKMKARGTVEREAPDGVRLVENADAARVQLIFPGKPDEATRALLKSNGFRWAPSEGAWQRHLNNAGRWAAERVLEKLSACPS
jgi:hypothetical protein